MRDSNTHLHRNKIGNSGHPDVHINVHVNILYITDIILSNYYHLKEAYCENPSLCPWTCRADAPERATALFEHVHVVWNVAPFKIVLSQVFFLFVFFSLDITMLAYAHTLGPNAQLYFSLYC